jgi:hypothetical protein
MAAAAQMYMRFVAHTTKDDLALARAQQTMALAAMCCHGLHPQPCSSCLGNMALTLQPGRQHTACQLQLRDHHRQEAGEGATAAAARHVIMSRLAGRAPCSMHKRFVRLLP